MVNPVADVAGEARPVDVATNHDLVVIALSGVQRFIAESRTTADLNAGSAIVAELSAEAARVCGDAEDATVVYPVGRGRAADYQAIPNRVVALVRQGRGEDVARRASAAVHARWQARVREALETEPVETPGMPSVQWVVVPAGAGGYGQQWALAQTALVARKRIRDHCGPEWERRQLCTQSPRWPAQRKPRGAPAHDEDQLSAANWVKRRWPKLSKADPDEKTVGFPSTSSIASAPYRRAVLDRLGEEPVRAAVAALHQAWRPLGARYEASVPGLRADSGLARWFATAAGVWVYPGSWQADGLKREFPELAGGHSYVELARQGHKAAVALAVALAASEEPRFPPNYLAVLVQDLDDMGKFLSGELPARPGGSRLEVSAAAHQRVSGQLGAVARAQVDGLRSAALLGTPVYAGGDDLLAFVPAEAALAAARLCHDAVPDDLRTPSTAVLFFHRTSSLRRVIEAAARMLDDAKASSRGKHALAVGFLRRSGVRERSIQPWTPHGSADQRSAADLFQVFLDRGGRGTLSPRLVSVLERDAAELGSLTDEWYRPELARLVGRHGGDSADAQALTLLGGHERGGSTSTPQRAARVAVFLRQECRPFQPVPVEAAATCRKG